MLSFSQNFALRVSAALLSLVLVAVPARAVETGKEAEQSKPAFLHGIGIDQKLGAQLPLDLRFKDEDGKTVRLGDYFDHKRKPVLLSLVYYSCPNNLCSLSLMDLTKGMNGVSTLSVGDDYEVITVSFDPKETPAQATDKKETYLASYRRPNAAAGWHFLTGDQDSIDKLTTAVGFHYRWDDKFKQYMHPTGHIVMTPDGVISRYFFGIDYDLKDFRLSLEEASSNRIGSITDKILLYCFHYDESTNRYTATISMFLRLGGLLTVAALGAFWFAMQKFDSARPPAPPRPQE